MGEYLLNAQNPDPSKIPLMAFSCLQSSTTSYADIPNIIKSNYAKSDYSQPVRHKIAQSCVCFLSSIHNVLQSSYNFA